MPTADAIASEQERLYESSSLRDDLNDAEAQVLLQWGQAQVERMAADYPDEFEQKCRFLRQLIKNINRFVGQREFNELEGQQKYMRKVGMYLPQLGWHGITEELIFAQLPDDKADMTANLQAVLQVLSPVDESAAEQKDENPFVDSPAHRIHQADVQGESPLTNIGTNTGEEVSDESETEE